MGQMRQKMMEDIQLHGLARSTRKTYIHVLKQVSRHFWKPSPASAGFSTCFAQTVYQGEILWSMAFQQSRLSRQSSMLFG